MTHMFVFLVVVTNVAGGSIWNARKRENQNDKGICI